MFAVRDEHGALDVVQDAMLKLTEKYSAKPAAELPMLFQRILQNTIHDHFRRQKVRSTWTTLLSALGKGDEKDDDFDPLEEHRQLRRRLCRIFLRQLEHGVLHDVERGFFVVDGKHRLLEGAALNGFEKAG